MNTTQIEMFFRSPLDAFDNAIALGVLSADPSGEYAGDWMYMHTYVGRGDAFKNINTREYMYVPIRGTA